MSSDDADEKSNTEQESTTGPAEAENEATEDETKDKSQEEPIEEPQEEPQDKPKDEPQEEPIEEPKTEPETETSPEASPESSETQETPEIIETKPEKKSKGKKGEAKPEGKKAQKGEKGEEAEEHPDFKYMIRVANTNVDGHRTIPQGLTAIKGIGIRMATIITDKLNFPRNKRIGDLTDDEVDKLVEVIDKLNDEVPGWLMNRQNDFDSGNDVHVISSDVSLILRDDINRLKKIRCYRGIRHEQGQKVRGQRTRANGRTGMTVGVQRKSVQQQQSTKKK